MEFGEIDKSQLPEVKFQEEVFPVKLRTPLVNYFQTGLSNIYMAKQQEIQIDGNYQKNLDFKNSPFSKLIAKLAPPEEEGEPQSHRVIDLSQEDISLMTGQLDAINPSDYADSRAHRELVAELKGNFQSAKTSALLKRQASKVKGFFTKK